MTVRLMCSFAALALMLLLYCGCEEGDVPKNDYFPLRDGNHWEYRLLDRPLLGRLNAGQEIVTAPLNADPIGADAEIEPKAELIDDKPDTKREPAATARRVALELQAAVGDELTYKATYDTAEQVWSKRDGYVGFQGTHGRSYLLILPPHTRYRWVVTNSAGQNLYFEIETARGEVTTPAGKFANCAIARQESRDRKEMYKYWFAPGVGLVRRSKYFSGEEVFRQELVDYKVLAQKPETRAAEEKEVKHALEGKKRGNEFKNQDSKEARASRLDDLDDLLRNNEKVQKYGAPR
ncbi:MAG TPA: hypothetical protein VKX17_07730 [Planctomycetota bacterium]|nr:hypothetical protein [Planctomycetota bacterium]